MADPGEHHRHQPPASLPPSLPAPASVRRAVRWMVATVLGLPAAALVVGIAVLSFFRRHDPPFSPDCICFTPVEAGLLIGSVALLPCVVGVSLGWVTIQVLSRRGIRGTGRLSALGIGVALVAVALVGAGSFGQLFGFSL